VLARDQRSHLDAVRGAGADLEPPDHLGQSRDETIGCVTDRHRNRNRHTALAG
jgi:hypothetical protein